MFPLTSTAARDSADKLSLPQWAAINNQYAMCKFLIERGAPINKKGGESVATPLQWAAQRCHYYTVHLLIQHGADPLITDAQGYNTLHISTFNGNLLLIILLLHQGIPVDVEDSYGHTSLMWAAYKGYPACVDVFLRWGASVHAKDEQGFTALHWALVKGSHGCIQKLIEYGADRFAKTTTGKTPSTTARELNTAVAWHKALYECGYDEEGNAIVPSWPGASYFLKDRRGFTTKFFFLWPFVLVWVTLIILAGMPVYAGIPFGLLAAYTIQWVGKQVLVYAPPDMRQFERTVGTTRSRSFPAALLTVLILSLGWPASLLPPYFWLGLTGFSPFSRILSLEMVSPSALFLALARRADSYGRWDVVMELPIRYVLRPYDFLLRPVHGRRPWFRAQAQRHCRAEGRYRRADQHVEVRRGALLRHLHDTDAAPKQALSQVSALRGQA
jgi:hypothetical protein